MHDRDVVRDRLHQLPDVVDPHAQLTDPVTVPMTTIVLVALLVVDDDRA